MLQGLFSEQVLHSYINSLVYDIPLEYLKLSHAYTVISKAETFPECSPNSPPWLRFGLGQHNLEKQICYQNLLGQNIRPPTNGYCEIGLFGLNQYYTLIQSP